VSAEWSVTGYTPVRELGRGSTGRVVCAVHDATGTPVAIKYLSARAYDADDFTAGLRAEAGPPPGAGDPHLVQVFARIRSPHGVAIVMELVDGRDLSTLLKAWGAIGPEAALSVLKDSLAGLASVHAVGAPHGDHKPGNVLVRGDGLAKLTDVGIAVRADEAPAGTPAYMAPELWRGDPMSAVSDLYAATAVFCECLTGERAFPAGTFAELAAAHRFAPIPVHHVAEPLRDLVARGLAKDPDHRPASATEFLDRLETAAGPAYGPGWEHRGREHLSRLMAILALGHTMAVREGLHNTTGPADALPAGPLPAWPGTRETGECGTTPPVPGAARSGADGRRTGRRSRTTRTAPGGRRPVAAELGGMGQRSLRRGVLAATTATLAVILAGGGVAVVAAVGGPKPKRHLAVPSPPAEGLGTASTGPWGDPNGRPQRRPGAGPSGRSSGPTSTETPALPRPRGSEPRSSDDPGEVTTPTPSAPQASEPFAATGVDIARWSREDQTGHVRFTVTANGRGPIDITVTYTAGENRVGDEVMRGTGSTSYEFASQHEFTSACEAWTVTVTAQPGNAVGSATIPAQACETKTPEQPGSPAA
jgi:serine/threonine-protein kinase